MSLRRRTLVGELMDDPRLPPGEHRRALRGLARLNAISGAAAHLWRHVRPCAERGELLRVLDVACGGGDLTLALVRRARRAGVPVQVTACDMSSLALEQVERAASRDGSDVRTVRLDATRDELPGGHDVAIASLFLHHLDDTTIVQVLRRMAHGAARRVVVNELERTAAGLALVALGAAVLGGCRVVRVDAVRSVRAAFTATELRDLAVRAGLGTGCMETHRAFPARLLLTVDRAGVAGHGVVSA